MKSILLTSLAALLGVALVPQADAPSAVKDSVATLHDAKTLKAELTVRKIAGGSVEKETLEYGKDGMFKIETPSSLAVSDGKTVWVLDKAKNTYTEGPANLDRTKNVDVWAYASFFNAEALKGVKGYVDKSVKTIRGVSVHEFQLTLENDKQATIYLDTKTNLPRGYVNDEYLILAPTVTSSKDAADTKDFAFTAPEGAKKEAAPAAGSASFADVKKILVDACVSCHSDRGAKAGLSVESYDSIMKKVTPGNAEGSSLYRSVSGARPKMPRGGDPLTKDQLATIAAWINAGAKNE
ncbi:MAG: hypothetical protein GC165_04190 [Armatimonadetes bacterium]|nr:hypothetical protein [Armatimonadota bacterium]MBS1727552.1 hypothetical protein [Armatimonadota bacterium]